MGGRDESVEVLERAGLSMVGDWDIEEVLPPPFARRHVVAWEAEPTVTVAADRPDLVAEINAQWHRLACEAGILDEDGVFLIDFSGNRTGRWFRVRLTDGWDLAAVLGERPGQPEFVTMSQAGDALVGATTEEYDVWLVAVDRLRERQEDAARAAAEETTEERAAAWESLFEGPKPTERLLQAWSFGLSLHPALPEDLHPLLLERSNYALYRPLPTKVVAAMLAHPNWKMRVMAAEYQSDITPEQWSSLILGAQDERRRWIFTMLAAERRAALPEDLCRRLAADPSARIRSEAAHLTTLPTAVAVALAGDPDDGVRYAACHAAWPDLDAGAREALMADADAKVRAAARLLHHRQHPMPRSVYETLESKARVLESSRLERDLAAHLARHGEDDERRALARNPRLDADLVALLGEDPDEAVRFLVSTRADLTEDQRAGIRIDFDPGVHHHELDWVVALHKDHDAMRRLAASTHPLVRRSVARARHLPPDVVDRLARDEDRVVQLFLAESCDDAPADMLMRVWQWWDGSLSTPDRPRSHPNFPRQDLLRHADDPNPRMRRLALDDPESTPELVERLSRDPSREVRYRAATDPRLSPVAAALLLEDPHDSVRHAAARHPHLPVRLLTRLLRGDGDAQAAAGNPALPVDVMRRMAERIGVPAPEGG
ncbi:HEAT repeat domain-containing protein [Streptomyces sp. uw30]|uniref:HEAT repeat domain-containing protein n=1 Tax=Streptomyces sp. uw30 TaxID=1828179 RepID=UPI0011CD705A|nr:HEAT repeat domain-containing protein [Streptomyces sp. uw30]TXS42379.1 HEAT repeat domain-containing protein [Streptomyces sp. uw30]